MESLQKLGDSGFDPHKDISKEEQECFQFKPQEYQDAVVTTPYNKLHPGKVSIKFECVKNFLTLGFNRLLLG